ncbi:hypothetical protein [Hoeflea poritis]|uniref:Uncharacterized protein n=1 Tax=Hoeflea poritis TaxID=2993659 RepID=A0ABT4VJ95_9HYPH|nr:hypothetical protein [Hoeflea poritis]MDA4844761.1 hypothetical protein [Hoeflea poritis]
MKTAGIGLLLAAMVCQTPHASADCAACMRFEVLRPDGGSMLFDDMLKELEERPVAIVAVKTGPFCDEGPGATVAAELQAASERQLVRAEAIAQKVGQCPRTCASTVNEAQYCAYSDRLVADRYRLGAIGLRLSELLHIYEQAGKLAEHPIGVLFADVELFGDEALETLRQAQRALENGDASALPDVRWQASETEINRLFGVVSLLVDFALIEGDTEQVEQALEAATGELRAIHNDLSRALTRTRVMEPHERTAFEERILTAASNVSFAIASFERAAAASGVATQTGTSADVKAIPPGLNSTAVQETVGCLNRLLLSAMTGSQAPALAQNTLQECRSFDACGDRGSVDLPANMSLLKAFLATQEEAGKQTMAFLNTICSSN